MKVKVRADSVEIEGYVNAIERDSKPLTSRIGKFIERICKGAFKRAIERNDNIRILLNHDWDRDLGGTKDGNLKLEEDAIGLHAKATITDKEVVESARRGDLVGWSFGFSDRDVENSVENGTPLRRVKDLDLYEVSLLDRTRTPAYEGTLVTARSADGQEQIQFRGEEFIDEVEIREDEEKRKEENRKEEKADNEATDETETIEKTTKIDYTKYEDMINNMKED